MNTQQIVDWFRSLMKADPNHLEFWDIYNCEEERKAAKEFIENWGKPSEPPTEPGWYYVCWYGNVGEMEVVQIRKGIPEDLESLYVSGPFYDKIVPLDLFIREHCFYGPVPMPQHFPQDKDKF